MMKWFLHIIQANRKNNQSLLQDWHRQHIGPEKQQPTMSTTTEDWPIQPWSKKNRKASGCQKMILQEWLRNMETYMHTTQHGMSDISWWTHETANRKAFVMMGCSTRMPETTWKLTCIQQSIIPYPYQCGMPNLYQRTHETIYKTFWVSETDCWGAMKDRKLWTYNMKQLFECDLNWFE